MSETVSNAQWQPDFGDENYYFLVRGSLDNINHNPRLITRNGISYPLKKSPPNLTELEQTWMATPSIDSNGLITNLVLEGFCIQEDPGLDLLWIKQGRIAQLSKTKYTVLVKIIRPSPRKALNLVLREPLPEMKVGQVWSITARLQEHYFVIQSAQKLVKDKNQDNDLNSSVTNAVEANLRSNSDPDLTKQTNLARFPETVKSYLEETTAISDWTGDKRLVREDYQEWNFFSQSYQLNARVIIATDGEKHLFTWGAFPLHCYSHLSERDHDSQDNRALKIQILGAAQKIGGNCSLVEIGNYSILLDCGLDPSNGTLPRFEDLTKPPDLVLITHAHIDNLGALPELVRLYPNLRIVSSPLTRELAHFTRFEINDEARESWRTIFWRWQTTPAEIDFFPLPQLKVKFINAGHLCGAVAVYLESPCHSLFYTGDFNNVNTRTTIGMKYEDLPTAEILMLSGTLGTQKVLSRKKQENQLLTSITNSVRNSENTIVCGGTAFAAIEIFLLLLVTTNFSSLNLPIYVHPKILTLFKLIEDNRNALPDSLKNFLNLNTGKKISQQTQVFRDFNQDFLASGPKVLLLDETELKSIFANAATWSEINTPQQHFILANIDDNGRRCDYYPDNLTNSTRSKSQANYTSFTLFNHADRIGVGQIFNRVNPSQLILINGNLNNLRDISSLTTNKENQRDCLVHIPECGDLIKSEQIVSNITNQTAAKSVVNSALTNNSSSSSVVDKSQKITVHLEPINSQVYILSLPNAIAKDPRWQQLLKNQNIQTTFSGSDLVFLNSNPPQPILNSQSNQATSASCQTCNYFIAQKCQQENSPLFELTVDPDGICSQYFTNSNNSPD